MNEEALKKMVAELAEKLKALNETVVAKFSNVDPAKAEAEKDALATRILELEKGIKALQIQKAVRKMAWSLPGLNLGEGVEGKSFADFMKAVKNNDRDFLNQMKAANGQNEGTNADGLYTVPTEYANEIIKLERQFSIARQVGRLVPMGSKTRLIPSQLTNPTVTWTGEAVNHTKTKITLSQITQTAKKISALIPITEELLEDNNVNLDNFIFQVVAEAIGREEDRVAFAGSVSGGDPFDGVGGVAGTNAVSMVGGSLAWEDVVETVMALFAPYRQNGVFVLGSTALKAFMKLRDDDNRPLWAAPVNGNPGTIWGKPYYETDQLTTKVLFGDFGRYLWLSDRGTYEVKASDSASDANGGAGSAFLQDEIWYKFRRREAITVAQPEAFAVITVA